MIPTLHLNGTSRELVLAQIYEAAIAVRAALVCLAGAAPNARDYYPQGAGAYARALGEHVDRADKLQSVYEELLALHSAIDKQEGR